PRGWGGLVGVEVAVELGVLAVKRDLVGGRQLHGAAADRARRGDVAPAEVVGDGVGVGLGVHPGQGAEGGELAGEGDGAEGADGAWGDAGGSAGLVEFPGDDGGVDGLLAHAVAGEEEPAGRAVPLCEGEYAVEVV